MKFLTLATTTLLAALLGACENSTSTDSPADTTTTDTAAWLATFDSSADYYDSLKGPGEVALDPDAEEIYRLCLRFQDSIADSGSVLLVMDQLGFPSYSGIVVPEDSTLLLAAMADYDARNVVPLPASDLALPMQSYYMYLPEDFLVSSDPFDYWDEFHAKFPASPKIIRLTDIGFDPEHTLAIVGISISCGSLCGGMNVLLFRKVEGVWVLDRTLDSWVS